MLFEPLQHGPPRSNYSHQTVRNTCITSVCLASSSVFSHVEPEACCTSRSTKLIKSINTPRLIQLLNLFLLLLGESTALCSSAVVFSFFFFYCAGTCSPVRSAEDRVYPELDHTFPLIVCINKHNVGSLSSPTHSHVYI